MAEIQSAKEAFYNLTSMDNFQTFYSHIFVFV